MPEWSVKVEFDTAIQLVELSLQGFRYCPIQITSFGDFNSDVEVIFVPNETADTDV